MANTEALKSRSKRKTRISGSFAPNGNSAVAASSYRGQGFTITRTGVGVFDILLAEKYLKVNSASFGVQLNAAAATLICMTGADNVAAATPKITITVMQESAGTFAAADIAANANNRIFFDIEVSEDTVQA